MAAAFTGQKLLLYLDFICPLPILAQLSSVGNGNAPVSVCLRTGACNATPCYYAHPHHVTQSHWKTTLLILSWINFPTNQANECLSGFCVPAVVLCARWFIIGKLVAAIAKAFKVAAAALAGLPPPSVYLHRSPHLLVTVSWDDFKQN